MFQARWHLTFRGFCVCASLAAPSASAVDFDDAPSFLFEGGASSCQHFKEASENFVTHTFMYVQKPQ